MSKIKKQAHVQTGQAQGCNKVASWEKGEFNLDEIFLLLF